jgi:HTH-type transcriptional regulator, sugar sensing transcriptional regulator
MLKDVLIKLKFNLYEREIILYLSTVKDSIAKNIYKNTKIPKGRIYSVLQDLKNKSIITEIPTNPKKYLIDDVKVRLENYMKSEQDELSQMIEETKSLKLFKDEESTGTPSATFFTGRAEHLTVASEMRDSAKEEILQIGANFIGNIKSQRSCYRALKREVVVKVITRSINSKNKILINIVKNNGGEVRFSKEPLFTLLIIDKKQLLLGVQNRENNEERMLVKSDSPALTNAMRTLFFDLWKQSV